MTAIAGLAVEAIAAITAGIGWRRARRAHRRDVALLGRALAGAARALDGHGLLRPPGTGVRK